MCRLRMACTRARLPGAHNTRSSVVLVRSEGEQERSVTVVSTVNRSAANGASCHAKHEYRSVGRLGLRRDLNPGERAVEDVTDPLMQKIRYLDKLVDELAKGKKMETILRK